MVTTINHIQINGCCGHYPYLLGILSIIQKKYNLNDVIFSSYSCGNIPALLCCLGIDIDLEFTLLNIPLLQELSKNTFGAFFNMIPVLKKYLLKRLNRRSLDIYKKANNRLIIHLTHYPSLKICIVKNYTSNEDLINACMASSNIFLYSGSLFYKYRDMLFIDGGVKKDRFRMKCANFVEIKSSKYRNIDSPFLFISTNIRYSKKLFNQGKNDAINNIIDYDHLPKRK